jgi:ERCC4-type nuclease
VPVHRGPEVSVLVDIHEPQTVIPLTLEALGARVVVLSLPAADYEVGDGVLVERKTVSDLHDSIVKGRFWRQIGLLRVGSAAPYLFVEGPSLDSGPLSKAAVRGVCVAAIDLGVRLIRTDDEVDSAHWLFRLAVRHQRRRRRDRPLYAQQPNGPESNAEAALAAIRGVSVTGARSLLAHFGTVASIAAATVEQLTEVPGIGAVRANAIRQTFHDSI